MKFFSSSVCAETRKGDVALSTQHRFYAVTNRIIDSLKIAEFYPLLTNV